MKTTTYEKNLQTLLKLSVKEAESSSAIHTKENPTYSKMAEAKVVVANENGLNLILNHFKNPLISIDINIIDNKVEYLIFKDHAFDELPEKIKLFLIEWNLILKSKTTHKPTIIDMMNADSEMALRHGAKWVTTRLQWLNKYCGHILKKDHLQDRIDMLLVNEIN